MNTIPEKNALKDTAEFMCLAARTAPKAKAVDNIETLIVSGAAKDKLAQRMEQIAKLHNKPGFSRDAKNLKAASLIVLIGTRLGPLNMTYCGLCGYEDCASMLKHKTRCAFNLIDLGIAAGSCASVAAHHHVDNRIMYSAGVAAIELGLFGKDVKVALGIPLSATGKNPFFDRKE